MSEQPAPPTPVDVVVMLCLKAARRREAKAIPLERLVTPELLEWWRSEGLKMFGKIVRRERLGIDTEPEYLAPDWVRVLLPIGVTEPTEPGQAVDAHAALVRFDGTRWLVHSIGPPDDGIEDLP